MSTQLTPISRQIMFSARYAGFGKFQVDLQRQELYLEGQRVKLHAKVYQALTLLLSRAGEIVTREEVRKQLWPDTYLANLNLDANINTTINKLRQVLGDALENPQYIETIPRRGYSFIAHVQFSETSAVSTTQAPNPIGAYSQAVRGGEVIFVSGQIPIDPATRRIIEGDARQQTEQVLKNIAQVLVASCLEPVFSIVLAALLLGESLRSIQAVGIVIVLVAIVIVQLPERAGGEVTVVEPIE